MQFERRKIHVELIPLPPQASIAVRQFRLDHFPFLWHCHPESELTLVEKGKGLRFVGNSIEPYSAGDICLLGSNLPHSWQSDPHGGQVHSICVQFREDWWGHQFLQLPELRAVRSLLKDTAMHGVRIIGTTATKTALLIEKMAAEESGTIRQLLILFEALRGIAEDPDSQRRISSEAVGLTVDDPGAALIMKAIAMLHEAMGDVLPTQIEIARKLGLTPSAFSRLFNRCVGKNYRDYLSEWRIGIACRALLETDDSIIDIALAAGFENLSNFHRRFRDLTGTTPVQWRIKARHGGVAVASQKMNPTE